MSVIHADSAPTIATSGDTLVPASSLPRVAVDTVIEQLHEHAGRDSGSVAPASADDLLDALGHPVEQWMVYLHPEQAALVDRRYSGPARVRGVAGTGKTVVALHRARQLAERYGQRVLFTTYVSNLPRVFGALFARMAPHLTGQVDFVNLHAWAHRFLRSNGEQVRLDADAVSQAFNEAYGRCGVGDTALEALGPRYLREELDWVIAGRGLDDLDDYLALARTGRGTPLSATQRRSVWGLHKEYRRQLDRRGTEDFNDLIRRAHDLLHDGRVETPYRSVVVDEVQDLSEVGLRLAHLLAGGDRPDGLFLVGDGQQAVYPGGFVLSHIGIDVRGRASHLQVNYRNTREILRLARGVVAGRGFDDGDEETTRHDDVVVLRDGVTPDLAGFDDRESHDAALIAAIFQACAIDGVAPGDVVVLVPTHALARHCASVLAKAGIVNEPLERYAADGSPRVKIGTFQRGKGLEFKQVLLPRVDADGLGELPRPGEDPSSHAERLELLRRQLFVAMTRARDRLWVGWVGEPAAMLGAIAASSNDRRRP